MKFAKLLFLIYFFSTNIMAQIDLNAGFISFGTRENFHKKEKVLKIKNHNYYLLNVFYQNQSIYTKTHIESDVISNLDFNDSFEFFLGKNSYVETEMGNLSFVFGRQIFPFFENFSWKDGFEGFSINYKLDNFLISIQLADFYRGFPLLEKKLEFEKSFSRKEKYKLRQGFFLSYSKKSMKAGLSFRYINLGNWGKYSKDINPNSEVGDQDFLSYTNLYFAKKWKFSEISILAILNQGVDKAIYRKSISSRNHKINGEAIFCNFTFLYKPIKVNFSLFVPDVDLRNQNGEIIEYGFVGIGTNPFSNKYLVKFLDFYPAAWVNSNGFEKGNQIFEGRQNSAFTSPSLQYQYKNFEFSVGSSLIYRRIEKGQTNGKISLKGKDYQKPFLEKSIKLSYQNFKTRPMEISAQFSYFKIKPKLNEDLLENEPNNASFFAIQINVKI